jgi:hypothetical protein
MSIGGSGKARIRQEESLEEGVEGKTRWRWSKLG